MADIHVLEGNDSGRWQVAIHSAVPDAVNPIGVNWRTALVNSGLGGTSTMAEGTGPGQIGTAELATITSGAVCEHIFSFRVEGNGDDLAVIRDALRVAHARESALVITKLQERLKYYGHTENQA